MSRTAVAYGAERNRVAGGGQGYSAEAPTAGFYRFRLRHDGHPGGVRIWRGPQLDPIDGSELDRHHVWHATFNGAPIDLDRVWPRCGRDPITEAEHEYYCKLQGWAECNAPDSPQADASRKIDLLTAPLPF